MSESESLLHILLPLVDVSAPGIFRLSGNNIRQLRLIDALRCGQDTKALELNSHDVATVVKQVLREFPGRLFDSTTESVLSRLAKDNTDFAYQRIQEVLKTLSPDRISFLALVLPFLHKVSQMSDVNMMDSSNLARVTALDFFPDICNPTGTDSTLVRQIIDWRIKVIEKLIEYGDKIMEDVSVIPVTPVSQQLTSTTPVYGKSESTTSCVASEASQKRKRPPQSPLKSVWHGLTNIFSKTPRPGRPESTPPNTGTPSFFSRVSNRLCPSGKKVKHEEDEGAEMISGYRSDDNSLRCPPVKQNLRAKFSHKKKSPKVTTPCRLKTPSTPLYASNYGTFTKNPFPVDQVRTELFHFTRDLNQPSSSSAAAARNDALNFQFGNAFVFSSSTQNLAQQDGTSVSLPPPLSPVNISPDIPDDDSTNPLVDNHFTGESNNSNSNSNESSEAFGKMVSEDAMETATYETEVATRPTTSNSSNSLYLPVRIPEPSPSLSHLQEEMRDNLCDLLNIGGTPRCRLPVMEKVRPAAENLLEPVVETTFDGKDENEKRLIAQVRRQLGSSASQGASGSRRPSVANLERMGQVSQGRRLWEQGIPCTGTLSNQPSSFTLGVQNGATDLYQQQLQLQSNSFPRFHAQQTKRQTDL